MTQITLANGKVLNLNTKKIEEPKLVAASGKPAQAEYSRWYCLKQISDFGAMYLFRPSQWKEITKETILDAIDECLRDGKTFPKFSSHPGYCIKILIEGHNMPKEQIADFLLSVKDIHLERYKASEERELTPDYYMRYGQKYFREKYNEYKQACILLDQEPEPMDSIIQQEEFQEQYRFLRDIKKLEKEIFRIRNEFEEYKKKGRTARKRKRTISEKRLDKMAKERLEEFAQKHNIKEE